MKMPPVIPLTNLHVDNVIRDLRYWNHRVSHLTNGIRLDVVRKVVWRVAASLKRNSRQPPAQTIPLGAVPGEFHPPSTPSTPVAPLLLFPAMAAATGAGVLIATVLTRRR